MYFHSVQNKYFHGVPKKCFPYICIFKFGLRIIACLFSLQMLSISSVKDISLFPVSTIVSICSSYYDSRIPIRELIDYVCVRDLTVPMYLGLN